MFLTAKVQICFVILFLVVDMRVVCFGVCLFCLFICFSLYGFIWCYIGIRYKNMKVKRGGDGQTTIRKKPTKKTNNNKTTTTTTTTNQG